MRLAQRLEHPELVEGRKMRSGLTAASCFDKLSMLSSCVSAGVIGTTDAPGRNRRGQTLVIAIMVMFLLGMVAAVFIAMVARNLFRSERFANVDSVAQIAEAGIRFADKMLTSSEDGADWRPTPDNEGVLDPGNPSTGVEPTPDDTKDPGETKTHWEKKRDGNPDFKWTRAYWPTELPANPPEGVGYAGPTGGYTTYNVGGGRFLLRVTYNPDPSDSLSKFIRIESIGRWGVFDNNDPTTYKPYGDVLLRRELTAYKPIGLTDYLRFITNKDNRSMDFPLGWQGGAVRFGRLDADTHFGERGAPIRVNGNLAWHGDVMLYLRGVGQDEALIPVDRVEVSGEIRRAGGSGSVELQRMRIDGTAVGSAPVALLDSAAPGFVTVGGFYRDGSPMGDASLDSNDKPTPRPRGVKRIEPPLVDQRDPTGATTRYRLLSLNSGERVRIPAGAGWKWFNLGQYGWGRGVYVGNTRDKQDESETLVGGYTLISDWLKPNNLMSTYWKGPYYIPPAAIMTLHPYDTDKDGQPDFTITRTDTPTSGRKWVWFDAWGVPRPEWGQTITMPYPVASHNTADPDLGADADKGRVIFKRNPDGSYDKRVRRVIEGNGVIYAEGNIRIRGMLPPNTQLTVVSNETIYIDGNLLKYRDPATAVSASDPWRGTEQTNTCGLALLARENICVNTTMFFAPLNSIGADDIGSDARDLTPPFHVIVSNDPSSQLRCQFECGPWETETTTQSSYDWHLFLRHAGDFGPTYINAWLNPSSVTSDWGILPLNAGTVPALPPYLWGVGDPRFNSAAAGWGFGTMFACDAFPLLPGVDPGTLFLPPGIENLLQIGLDQTSYTRNNYLMGGLAIQPMDIRIEAVMYAQEGSFFVLPGQWFNPNPSDNDAGTRSAGVNPRFPFFGQPLDVRVIIDGAVSENIPAAMGAVDDWMSKWGVIPAEYGSSGVATAHSSRDAQGSPVAGEGLTILYDDHCGWPYSNLRGSGTLTPIRTDRYGRALPIAPRLPVCGSLIYQGDVL